MCHGIGIRRHKLLPIPLALNQYGLQYSYSFVRISNLLNTSIMAILVSISTPPKKNLVLINLPTLLALRCLWVLPQLCLQLVAGGEKWTDHDCDRFQD